MGLKIQIAKVISSSVDAIRTAIVEIYPNHTKRARCIFPPGIDGVPLDDADQALILEVGTGGKTAYIGSIPVPIADKGEIRIYSRDADGNLKASVHCKNNGDIEIVSVGGKIAIDNQAEKLKVLMNDLIKEIKDIVTIGSPSVHTIKPTTKALFDTLDDRFNNLFKEA